MKKDIQKLQRAIVDGLEDVKAQEVQVFDVEHLSALFERVIVASGTSNRQTKALAASVRDAVREAGFAKPRVEGEENGEWIIVDCGSAVVHIMQPSIRQYYRLEELWGEKPIRLKLGAAKPKPTVSTAPAAVKTGAKGEPSLKRSSAAKKGVAQAFASKAQMKKDAAKSAAAKTARLKSPAAKLPARKTATSTGVAKTAVAKTVAAKSADKKTNGKTASVKTPSKKTVSRAKSDAS